jgi:hypothetical protein
MTKTSRKDPPLTAPPLDYVPFERLSVPGYATPTQYKPPSLRRAGIAASIVGLAGVFVFLAPIAAVGILAMCGAIWVGGKIADRLNAYDHE